MKCGCCHADGISSAGLWRMPAGNDPLEQTAVLKVQATQVRAAAWHPQDSAGAVTVEDRSVVQWRLEGASAEVWPGGRAVFKHARHLQRFDNTASVAIKQCCFGDFHTTDASARDRVSAMQSHIIFHGPV